MSNNKRQSNRNASSTVERNASTSDQSKKQSRTPNRRHTKPKKQQGETVREKIARDSRKPTANDVSWYVRNAELAKSAASIQFASILGTPYTAAGATVPGVSAFTWTPAFGSQDLVALNQSSDSMYSYVVHANSRDYSYDAPDQMILIIAGMNVFSFLGSLIRVYGILKKYEEENLYYPDVLIRAVGFNPSDLRDNLSHMWFDINNLIDQSRQIWIPNVFPQLQRWFWLNSNVFLDAPSSRAQSYVFVQKHYFAYSEVKYRTGGSLVWHKQGDVYAFGPDQNYTWQQAVQFAQSMIQKLIDSQDRGNIYANLLNAYGRENLYALSPIPADFKLEPAYNAEVLMQIENATFFKYGIGEIFQSNNRIKTAWQHDIIKDSAEKTSANYGVTQSILNFHVDGQPSPDMIIEATRAKVGGFLTQTVFVSGNTDGATSADLPALNNLVVPYAVGSEILHDWILFGDPKGASVLVNPVRIPGPGGGDYWSDVMSFDWHPFLYVITAESDVPVQTPAGQSALANEINRAYGDFDNYTLLPVENLKKLHDMCLFSLWGVPHI
nr:putative capsid [Marmot picobirnavirus]